jgi:hypothetical protein
MYLQELLTLFAFVPNINFANRMFDSSQNGRAERRFAISSEL